MYQYSFVFQEAILSVCEVPGPLDHLRFCRIGVYAGDRLVSETVLESVEANPPLAASVFSPPATAEGKVEK